MRNVTLSILTALALMLPAACDDRPPRHTWQLTGEGVALHKAGARDPVRVSLPDWLWVGEPYGCGPALAMGPSGEAVITSDVVPVLWRVDPDTLNVTVHALELDRDKGRDVGFSTLNYSIEHGAFIAISGLDGSLWKIDGRLSRAERMPAFRTQARACTAPIVGIS